MNRILLVIVALAAVLQLPACSSGPSLPAACEQPPESGRCRAAHTRWWFDERGGTCKAFIWGGCDGSVPFETLEACQAQCLPGQPLPAQSTPAAAAAMPPAPAAAPVTDAP